MLDLAPVPVLSLAPHERCASTAAPPSAGRRASRPNRRTSLLVGQPRPIVDRVVDDPAVEHQVLGAGHDAERVELEVLHRAHRALGACEPRHRRPGQRPCRPRMNRRAVSMEILTTRSLAAISWHQRRGRRRHDMTDDRSTNLRDIGDVPALDVWGDTVQARVIVGRNATLAVVELGTGAIVPEHRHEHEQLGLCIEGSITFTIDGERRALGPGGRGGSRRTCRTTRWPARRRGRRRHLLAGPCRLGCAPPIAAGSSRVSRAGTPSRRARDSREGTRERELFREGSRARRSAPGARPSRGRRSAMPWSPRGRGPGP